jgi:hypothetical protein
MGDVSEAAKAKALSLANDEGAGWSSPQKMLKGCTGRAFARYVQDASDVAKVCRKNCETAGDMPETVHMLSGFILPEPVDIVTDLMRTVGAEFADNCLRAELAKRGLEIRPVQS